jgi:hypothetical protein
MFCWLVFYPLAYSTKQQLAATAAVSSNSGSSVGLLNVFLPPCTIYQQQSAARAEATALPMYVSSSRSAAIVHQPQPSCGHRDGPSFLSSLSAILKTVFFVPLYNILSSIQQQQRLAASSSDISVL